MICDASRPIALAGIMGGENSEIRETTTDILLESAYFDASSIRKTSKVFGLSTDSSFRFERGADPEATVKALRRAIDLIREIAGGTLVHACDEYPTTITRARVDLRISQLERILGMQIPVEETIRILGALGIENTRTDDRLQCLMPTFRPDLSREIDLIEEVARVYGYHFIPTPMSMKVRTGNHYDDLRFVERIRRLLTGLGVNEIQSSSLIELRHAESFAAGRTVSVKNPVSSERPALRPSILPSLLECIDHNMRNGNHNLRLFEIGTTFRWDTDEDGTDRVSERQSLGLAIAGNAEEKTWYAAQRETDIFDLKGMIESFLEMLQVDKLAFICYDAIEPLSAMKLFIESKGVVVGHLSELSKEICKTYDINDSVFAAELDIDALERVLNLGVRFKPPISYPIVKRDLAFLIERNTRVAQLLATIDALDLDSIRQVKVVDIFEHESFGRAKKSVALSLSLQAADHTLTDDEINRTVQTVVTAVTQSHSASLRST